VRPAVPALMSEPTPLQQFFTATVQALRSGSACDKRLRADHSYSTGIVFHISARSGERSLILICDSELSVIETTNASDPSKLGSLSRQELPVSVIPVGDAIEVEFGGQRCPTPGSFARALVKRVLRLGTS
jgi:hypothetical protein